MLLLTLALLGWLSFQTWQLFAEQQQLKSLRAEQDAPLEKATKLRASLDAVAAGTARLANDGNTNARVIVEELRKRGITINPNGSAK